MWWGLDKGVRALGGCLWDPPACPPPRWSGFGSATGGGGPPRGWGCWGGLLPCLTPSYHTFTPPAPPSPSTWAPPPIKLCSVLHVSLGGTQASGHPPQIIGDPPQGPRRSWGMGGMPGDGGGSWGS